MVPDSLSRRTLLAGAGTALGAGLLGTGLFAPTWLPDSLTDELVVVSPEPPAHLWRPEVSEAHADEAVDRLARTVEEAETLADRIDVDSLSEETRFHLRGDPSGGHLSSAREASDPRERLFSATSGVQYAGETVGHAKVVLGEVDPDAVVERGESLRASAADVLDSLGDYPVSEPTRDLAVLYFVERELSFARLDSHRGGVFAGDTAAAEEYSAHDVATTFGSHLQARQRVENARYYRDLYRDRLGDDTRPYAGRLADARATLSGAVDEYPRRHEVQNRLRERGVDQSTPYGAARWELHALGYDDDFRFGFDGDGYRTGHAVERVVETARALMGRRAHEFALDELDVAPES